jgi:hypothetical protein
VIPPKMRTAHAMSAAMAMTSVGPSNLGAMISRPWSVASVVVDFYLSASGSGEPHY